MRIFKWAVAVLLAGLGGFVVVSVIAAWVLTGPSRRTVGEIPDMLPAATRTVSFPARDGIKLSGWFVPCDQATKAVVLLHGHGSSRRQMLARAKLFHDAGYAALLYDARGHGLSEGDKVSAGWFETADLLGAIDYLRAQNFRQLGCLGESQGGATILLAAEQLPAEVRWVIVESCYPTIRDALDRRFRRYVLLPGWLAGMLFIPLAEDRLHITLDQVDPINHIAHLRCPVFVLGGTKDVHTLPQSTQSLFSAANEPKELWLVNGAAHVDLFGFAQAEYAGNILRFVAKAENMH